MLLKVFGINHSIDIQTLFAGGKKALHKLEQKVRELEMELDSEQRKHQDTDKNLKRQERKLKEMAMQAEEDKKNQERLNSTIDSLQQKIKIYKRQVEEAVSIGT